MISNAKDRNLNQNSGTLPDLSDALLGLFQTVKFVLVEKTVVNYEVVENFTYRQFYGVVQPAQPQQLQMKPQGQRAWKWYTIHALPDLKLNVDDVIFIGDFRYRIMSCSDMSLYGYVEYGAVQDYQDTPTAPPVAITESPKKWDGDIIIDNTLTIDVDISGQGIDDAFDSIWQVTTSSGAIIPARVDILGTDNIQVTVTTAGTYKLLGVQ